MPGAGCGLGCCTGAFLCSEGGMSFKVKAREPVDAMMVGAAALGSTVMVTFVIPTIMSAITVFGMKHFSAELGQAGTFQAGLMIMGLLAVMQGIGCVLAMPAILKFIERPKHGAVLGAIAAVTGLICWHSKITMQLAMLLPAGAGVYGPMAMMVLVSALAFVAFAFLYSWATPNS